MGKLLSISYFTVYLLYSTSKYEHTLTYSLIIAMDSKTPNYYYSELHNTHTQQSLVPKCSVYRYKTSCKTCHAVIHLSVLEHHPQLLPARGLRQGHLKAVPLLARRLGGPLLSRARSSSRLAHVWICIATHLGAQPSSHYVLVPAGAGYKAQSQRSNNSTYSYSYNTPLNAKSDEINFVMPLER